MKNWQSILTEIEEVLIPHFKFNIWERGMYSYLLSQTHLKNLPTAVIPLSKISEALNCSDFQARETIRELAKKGCIELEQTRKGHSVKVHLPEDLGLFAQAQESRPLDIETINFFQGRAYLTALMERENSCCFYCLSEISSKNCELDHVLSQRENGDNSYKNIVAACHKCNTQKQDQPAKDFIRSLYRKGKLSDSDMEERLLAVDALQAGNLKPKVS